MNLPETRSVYSTQAKSAAVVSRTNRPRLRLRLADLPRYLFIGLILLYMLFPIYWMFISSLKSPARLFTVEYWPRDITLVNYRILTFNEELFYGLYNSIIVSVVVLLLTLAIGALGAFALGRLPFRGRHLVRYAILGMTAFPQIAIVGGLYLLVANPCVIFGGNCPQLQLYNTRSALILTYLILTVPLTVWFLAAYYQDLPDEIEDAAYIDGASPFQTFLYIFLPLSAPGLVTTGLLAFIVAWNEFLFAVTFTIDESARTAPLAISRYGWGAGSFAMAAAFLVTIPVMMLAIAFQRQITTGLSGIVSGPKAVAEETPHQPWLPARWRQRLLTIKPLRGLLSRTFTIPEKILGVMLGLGLLLFVYHTARIIPYPYSVDYAEGPLLDQLNRLADFENIYRPGLDQPPYTITNYTPVYLLVQLPFRWLFGPAYWYGRLLSWLAMLGAAACLGLTLYTLTKDRAAAVIAGLMLLVVPYTGAWAALYRIDALALGLSWAGLFIIVRWPDKRWSLLATAVLLTLAVYTRQSYGLAAPLAAFVWLLAHRPRYRAFILLGLIGGLGLGLLALLTWLTEGGFVFHTIRANVNEFEWDRLAEYIEAVWLVMAASIILSGVYLLLGGWFRLKSWSLIAPYLIGATLSALTIGKIGSNVNYLLEFSAAISLTVAAVIAWQRPRPLIYNGLVLVLALQIFLFLPGSNNHWYTESQLEQPEDADRVMTIIEQADGPVIADEGMGMLPLLDRPIYIQPFEVTQLAFDGVWDQTPFVESLRHQDFEVILVLNVPGSDLREERWTPEMLQAIKQNYQIDEKIGDDIVFTEVYRPKGAPK